MNTSADALCLLIVLGVLVQLAWLLYPWDSDNVVSHVAMSGAIALIAFIPGKHAEADSVRVSILMAGGLFTIMLAQLEMDRLLPRIQEGTIVLWTALGLYALASAFGVHAPEFRIPCV